MGDEQQLLDNAEVGEYQPPTELPANPADVPLESREPDQEAAELTQERAKRKGGWQRKIEKLERERDHFAQLALERGTIRPREDMSPENWAAARNLQIRNGISESLIKAAGGEIEEPGSEKGDRSATAESDQDTAKQEPDSAAAYQERMAAFVAQHTDAGEVIGRIRMREEVADAVDRAIMEDENGPALAYYLGQHPELWETLSNMEPEAAVDHIAVEVTPKVAALSPKPLTAQEVENHESFLRKLTIKATLDPEFAEVTAAIAASGPPTPLLYHVTRVLADVENWEAVLGKIATNPQVLATMWGMHPHQSKLYLEGIAADLSNKPEDHAEESRSTKPPAPINPVRKVGATATGLSDDVPVEEWARRRNAQVAKQRGLR